jgi:hypothetical protein
MEKNGTNIDEDIKYFSWYEGSKIYLKLRKEMINEGMQEGDESTMQNEEAIEILKGYEILFYEENFRYYHNMRFLIIINQYMLHNKFMEEEISFMYEDKFIPIFERIFEHNYMDELKDPLKKKLVKEKLK